jgi:hypothetical protein
LDLPSAGTYWFKLVVYYGTEASGASRQFTTSTSISTPTSSVGGGIYSPSQTLTIDALGTKINDLQAKIESGSENLTKVLDMLGLAKPNMEALLSASKEQLASVQDVQNKLADLQAVSASVQQVVENGGITPVIQTYMKFGSVIISFLITNPASTKQTINFRSALPEEVTSKDIINLNGLNIDYDTSAKSYYVYGNITLGPKESIVKEVEMEDIWIVSQIEIDSIRNQTQSFASALENTSYSAQGVLLKNSIEDLVSKIESSQKQSYISPQDHILIYRNNKKLFEQANNNFDQLKNLVVQSGASQGLVGRIGGIQTFATWGIILAIIFGFALMGVVIFSMWRYQVVLASQVIESNRMAMARTKRKRK